MTTVVITRTELDQFNHDISADDAVTMTVRRDGTLQLDSTSHTACWTTTDTTTSDR